MPEFQSQALDGLRQPLETGEVAIARANHRIVYPARFQLVAAMNPCRCGHADDPGYVCRRQPNARCSASYLTRISGPLLDRFDLRIHVPAMSAADLILPPPQEGSAEVGERVARARAVQARRYRELGVESPAATNASAPARAIESIADFDDRAKAILVEAAERMRLSARGFHRVVRLARTIADLDAEPAIGRRHLAEALSYRGQDETQAVAA